MTETASETNQTLATQIDQRARDPGGGAGLDGRAAPEGLGQRPSRQNHGCRRPTRPRRRLIVEMLARTGLPMDEFCALTDDVIVKMNETNWLRVPVGTLHTDRS